MRSASSLFIAAGYAVPNRGYRVQSSYVLLRNRVNILLIRQSTASDLIARALSWRGTEIKGAGALRLFLSEVLRRGSNLASKRKHAV